MSNSGLQIVTSPPAIHIYLQKLRAIHHHQAETHPASRFVVVVVIVVLCQGSLMSLSYLVIFCISRVEVNQ